MLNLTTAILVSLVVILISADTGMYLSRYRSGVTEMLGMMIGMTQGMMAGIAVGYFIGAATDMFISNLLGVIVSLAFGLRDCLVFRISRRKDRRSLAESQLAERPMLCMDLASQASNQESF